MKIITLLFILVVSASSFANPINFFRKSVSIDSEETFKSSLSEECRIEYENSEYNICMPVITFTNYKDTCANIKTEKCQNFYNDPLKYYPICKDIPKFTELYEPNIIKTALQSYDVFCQTNENGDLCPYSLSLMTKVGDSTVLQDQCKSKKCTESLLKVYKDINLDQYASLENSSYSTGSYSPQELNAKNNLISILESDECKSLHVENTANATNDTSNTITIKANKILLILLSLLLFFLK